MNKRILRNDIKNNPLQAAATLIFMAVSGFMFALTCLLFVSLLTSVDALMEKALTPDFLQMHSGEISETEVVWFAENNENVLEYQTLKFLNLENGTIFLGGNSLADSTQDNGVCVQSGKFDFLLDTENEIIEAHNGEIYVPVCYRREYGLEVENTVQIGEYEFIIAGFLRDSQMNSMMASSKRFLVSPADYETLKSSGSEEYLIEFLLKDGADTNAFATDYADAGLPANGPAVTKPLIRLMNALSDGLMILVILLVSAVLLLISILCIRFTLLTQLAADKKEIGTMKAIGISGADIRRLYGMKFLALSGLGAVCGLLAAFSVSGAVSAQIRELYGPSGNGIIGFAAALAGVLLTEGVLLLSVRRTLKRTEKISAVEALTDTSEKQRGRFSPRHLLTALVIALGVFMMVLPQNLLSTISAPEFVTYMGIGGGEIRLDIRQSEDISGNTERAEKLLSKDENVAKYVALRTVSSRAILADGSRADLQIELGDHTVFPVTYSSGRAPAGENEIALSYLCADDLGLSVGEKLFISAENIAREYTVCGIYSDITNGGKTAKAAYLHSGGELMWSVFYVSLKDGVPREQWLDGYSEVLSGSGINVKAVDIREYVADTYGQTIREIRKAALAADLAAVLVMFTVVLLFTRLLAEEERNDISLKKALGFTSGEIRREYFLGYLPTLLIGIIFGILSGNFLGEKIAEIFLKTLGAAGFEFIINYKFVCGLIPAAAAVTVCIAVAAGLKKIKNIKAFECCMGRE